jgi:1A family penicillin-binding protein
MPIPGLSKKVSSPQDWRRKKINRFSARRPSNNVYSGKLNKGGKFSLKDFILSLLKKYWGHIAVAGALGLIISVLAVFWIARDLPDPNKIIDRSIALSTKIYDRTGEHVLYDIHGGEKRSFISLEELPKDLINATLTAEDRNFYQHKGLSISGILRSIFKNITTGSRVGGSTLTQQLVKNAILSPEKKYTRKIKEAVLSYQIERRFSKQEILQMYFNEIPYGSVAYGAEAASQTYFGKSVKEVSLAEAAILAALPQAPTYYSPFGSHTDALFSRQHWILDSMAELGYITKEDAEKAKEQPIEFSKIREQITAPHFVMFIKEYLTAKYGELAVEQGGLQVISTLDLYKQEIADEVVKEVAENNLNWNATNAAMVAIDPKTGQILAMVGSKDFFSEEIDGQVNVVIRPRQPGSSFKPIVYGASFEKGYTTETVLYDVNTIFKNYDGRDYEPKNYDFSQHGPVTIRKALAGSLNIPAVKTIYLTGVDNVINFAEKVGYTTLTERSRYGLALVLGGGDVKLLEHANAFGAFAREGEWHPAVAILEVKDKDGNVLEKYEENKKKAIPTEVARQVNSILSDNEARSYVFGPNSLLQLGSRPVAAKTGTTNDFKDAWTIGYTPSLVVGVWVGNNDSTSMKRGADGSIVAAPIWNRFMSRVLGDTPIEYFNPPAEITSEKPVLNGSSAGGIKVKIDKITGKLATEYTPEHLVEEKEYRQAHSILHYINKDDPQGDTPPNYDDPQYQRWEEGVKKWAEENKLLTEEPPTEYDDIHLPENKPTINFNNPQSGSTVSNRDFSAEVSVGAPRGVSRVEYYLNNQLIKSSSNYPYNLNVFISDPTIGNGFYELTAIAYDDAENSNSTSIDLNFKLSSIPTSIKWSSPPNASTLRSSDFPYTIRANLSNTSNIKDISVFYRDRNNNEYFINSFRQFGNQLSVTWENIPPPDQYWIFAKVTNNDDYQYKTPEIRVIIR